MILAVCFANPGKESCPPLNLFDPVVLPMQASSTTSVPTIPSVAIQLLELYDNPDVAMREIVELLQSDPALTAKIVKAANSPAYGIGREVADLKQAVSLLGKAIVTPLVLSFSLAEKSMPSQGTADLFSRYWLQAIVQAIAAECIALKYAKPKAGEWFVAGLLSSIGRLALINQDAEKYDEVMAHAEAQKTNLHEAEERLLETTTVDLSADLLREWNLPQRWVDAAANQFRMVEQLEALPDQGVPHQQLFVAIATASAVGSYFCRNCQGESLIRIVHVMEEGFGATEEDVTALLEAVRERLDAVSHLFQVQCSSLASPMELTTLAMQHLARLAVEQAMEQQRQEAPSEAAVEERQCLLKRIDRLMRRASTDSLTGTYNRGYFDDRFDEQVAAMIAASQTIGLVFIDVDHFKAVNDTHGHMAGDEVLRQVAEALKWATRSTDIVARYGGEEFVVMVTDPRRDDLAHLGERLRTQVEQMGIVYEGTAIPITISVGAAMGRPISVVDKFGERLIAAADKAMYEAKRGGRNRVVVADQSGHGQSDESASYGA